MKNAPHPNAPYRNAPYRIAIAGLGTVGLGLIELIEKNAALIGARAGRSIEIIGINARNRTKDRGLDLTAYPWIDDPMDMPDLDGIDGVVELIGGDSGTALTLARKTLAAGKDFITANKALLAVHGAELAETSEATGGAIAYEAAVAGAVPVIKTIRESLAGNAIGKIGGILNGTCNFILSAMESTGAAYGDVLKQAQDLGYAEADPTTDVGGFDAAHKLTLLSALAFGTSPDFSACTVQGIEGVSDQALAYADRLGYRIRLIGLADGKTTGVAPMAVPKDGPLGGVTGSHNAIQILCDQAGPIFLRGPGAGRSETASAVAGDLIDLALGLARPAFGMAASNLDTAQGNAAADGDSGPSSESHLVILRVRDEPGVMAALTQELAAHHVSVDQLLQPAGHDGFSDLALITHENSPERLAASWQALSGQAFVVSPIEAYRIERFDT